jgi:uncharacterized protein (TIGR03435 family)
MTTLPALWQTPWIAIPVNHLWQSTGFVLGIWLLTLTLRRWRKLLLPLAAVAVLAALSTLGLLHAQAQATAPPTGIEGTWQGTLPFGRIVWKIKRTDSGELRMTVHFADGNRPFGMPTSSVSFEGGVLKFAAMGADYKVTLSADNRSLSGTWTQGPQSGAVVMERATPATEWALPEPPAPVPPMAADANPSFEVATIKPSKADQNDRLVQAAAKFMEVLELNYGIVGMQGTRFKLDNVSFLRLIANAYAMRQKQIINAPAWLDSEKYDIAAQSDTPGSPSTAQTRTMVQKLLADRLQLKVHREERELPAYVLTPVKNGPMLKKHDPKIPPGWRTFGNSSHSTMTAGNLPLEFLVKFLQGQLDGIVVDQTGLQGKWDFELKWTPDSLSGEGGDEPPLLSALQQQLGLKVVQRKTMVPVLVIDHVERPSEN